MKQERSVDTVFSDCPSIAHLLRLRALHQPDRNVFSMLDAQGQVSAQITFAELDRQARAVAVELQKRGLEGERAMLLFPSGLSFLAAFFGCLYARVIAIPAPRPQAWRLARTLPRFRSLIASAKPALILTEVAQGALADELGPELTHIPVLSVSADACLTHSPDAWRQPALGRDSVAYLQYTSGSTSQPKGTAITHGNVLANSRDMQVGKRYSPDATSVVWVPHYHDDGLVQGILQPVYTGYRALLMSPIDFVARPASWLEAISRHRVTHAGGPNFAYELCVRKVTDAERSKLDLQSWTMAYCAAEPVRPDTLTRFRERFEARGFRWTSFAPSYGMAETTLVVSTDAIERGPRFVACDATALERNKRVVSAAQGDAGARVFVGCGRPVGETIVAIVDPQSGRRVREDEVGEIWVKGAGVAAGYVDLPDESQKTFGACIADTGEGPFLRTGDLGFLDQGEVFITGRLKDLIIVRGENRYPQDIEATVQEAVPDVRPGCIAAFSIERDSEEKLVVAAEVSPQRGTRDHVAEAHAFASVIERIRQSVAAAHGVEVDAVVLLSPGSLPKTSSGKIQRQAARADFLGDGAGELMRWSRAQHAAPVTDSRSPETPARTVAEIETFLAAEVAERLGISVPAVDVTAPFLHFGLDSVNSVAVAAALAAWLGTPLPNDLLGEQLSIRDVARVVRSGVPSANPTQTAKPEPAAPVRHGLVIELRSSIVRQPLFCLGGLTGMVRNLWPLACFLGDDRPFFALHTPGMDGSETPPRDVSEIATRLLPELRAVQPKGPYLLGGHSFGGFVAYEMAHQLEQQGELISAVMMLDATMPELGQPALSLSQEESAYELVNLFEHLIGGAAPVTRERLEAMSDVERFEALADLLQKSKIQLTGQGMRDLLDVFGASLEATAHYRPSTSSFPVKLFRAQVRGRYLVECSNLPTRLDMTRGLGWERVCQALEVIDVPGDHLSMVQQPHVRVLAQALKRALSSCTVNVKLRAAPALSEAFPYR